MSFFLPTIFDHFKKGLSKCVKYISLKFNSKEEEIYLYLYIFMRGLEQCNVAFFQEYRNGGMLLEAVPFNHINKKIYNWIFYSFTGQKKRFSHQHTHTHIPTQYWIYLPGKKSMCLFSFMTNHNPCWFCWRRPLHVLSISRLFIARIFETPLQWASKMFGIMLWNDPFDVHCTHAMTHTHTWIFRIIQMTNSSNSSFEMSAFHRCI